MTSQRRPDGDWGRWVDADGNDVVGWLTDDDATTVVVARVETPKEALVLKSVLVALDAWPGGDRG